MKRITYLLTKLAEEAAEVAQMASKTAEFGLAEKYQNGPSNAERTCAELTDLLTVTAMLEDEFNLGFRVLPFQISMSKVDKVNEYFNLAQKNPDLYIGDGGTYVLWDGSRYVEGFPVHAGEAKTSTTSDPVDALRYPSAAAARAVLREFRASPGGIEAMNLDGFNVTWIAS